MGNRTGHLAHKLRLKCLCVCNIVSKHLDSTNKLIMQAHLVSTREGTALFPMPRKENQSLQRTLSDSAFLSHEPEMIKCECCGMEEDCTPTYISKIRESFSGKWICGLCAEAVKELLSKDPCISKEKALEAHMAMCKKFNSTIRLNPNFYLASAMKDVAKKCLNRRRSLDSCVSVSVSVKSEGCSGAK